MAAPAAAEDSRGGLWMCGRWAKRLAARDREVAKLNLPVEVRWWMMMMRVVKLSNQAKGPRFMLTDNLNIVEMHACIGRIKQVQCTTLRMGACC
jgi:hypothetical protein